jgi:hypothetical protein
MAVDHSAHAASWHHGLWMSRNGGGAESGGQNRGVDILVQLGMRHGEFLHGVWIIGSKEIAPFQTFSCLHSPAKTPFRMAGE